MSKKEKEKQKRIELNVDQIKDLKKELQQSSLNKETIAVFEGLLDTLEYADSLLQKNQLTIRRFREMLFGSKTEKSDDLLEECSDLKKRSPNKKKKKNGKFSASDYKGAKVICVDHESLKSGEICPKCKRGKIYKVKVPKVLVRVTGRAPLDAYVYEMQKLRCNLCGETFTADTPKEAQADKHDDKAVSMIALLKYGSGFPFYRLEKLQAGLGMPLSTSTQWSVIHDALYKLAPVYDELIAQAAGGDIIHNDDTTVRILELMGKRRPPPKENERTPRKGMFTTGIVSKFKDKTIALYFSGTQHAGENLKDILQKRNKELEAPIQMCDGLTHNAPGDYKVILSNCLAHARRHFVQIYNNFPAQCSHIIKIFKEIYIHDSLSKEARHSPQERLIFHQEKSAPFMRQLKIWMEDQIETKRIEPNSGLGVAINYVLTRWDPLTLFLRKAGAPLDNNICERALKKMVLARKNSYFYKTKEGAKTGDTYTSIIHTCELAGANPFDYLTTIQENFLKVKEQTELWMPWNYKLNFS